VSSNYGVAPSPPVKGASIEVLDDEGVEEDDEEDLTLEVLDDEWVDDNIGESVDELSEELEVLDEWVDDNIGESVDELFEELEVLDE